MSPCFECGRPAAAEHHVVPRSRGGTRTVPLCLEHHALVHDASWTDLPALQRAGIERARSEGRYGGPKADPSQAEALSRMGYTAPEIAEALGVSPATARRYLRGAPTLKGRRCPDTPTSPCSP